MVDISGGVPLTALAGLAASVGLRTGSAGDPATWAAAPRPSEIGIRPGAGANGSDRVTLVWPDGAIRNTWLQVTVPALPEFGLSGTDVFYVGNLVGEVGNGVATLSVNSLDLLAVRRHFFSTSPVTGRFDFDRDGRVTATDFSIARGNLSGGLALLAAGPSAGAVAPVDRVAESVLK
jgi:hypothetical protein